MHSTHEITFGGHRLTLDASGALWWPAERILTVSDLHFEKATYLGQHGSFIAPYDTLDTIERLERLITHYQPQELILLGDSFHDRHAWNRLDESLRERILHLTTSVPQSRWIEGNHDSTLLRIADLPPFALAHTHNGLRFTHDAPEGALPHIIGHYHPKTTIALKNRHASGRCFLHTETLLIMPAFGSFTGSLDSRHETFRQLLHGEIPKRYLLYRGSIHKLPA